MPISVNQDICAHTNFFLAISSMASSAYAACEDACVDSVHSVLHLDLQSQHYSALPETDCTLLPHHDNAVQLMALSSALPSYSLSLSETISPGKKSHLLSGRAE